MYSGAGGAFALEAVTAVMGQQPEAEPQPEEADRPATAPTDILYGVPGAENVAVVCRVRPHSERELASEVVATDNGDAPFLQYTADGRGIMLARAHARHDFHFTRGGCQPRLSSSSAPADSPAGSPRGVQVFQPLVDQAAIYQAVAAPLVDAVMDGFNAAILCYGQTGAGKS